MADTWRPDEDESENNMRKYIFILTTMVSLLCAEAHAQTNRLIRQGNKLYQEGKYDKAATDYQKALQKKPNQHSKPL